MKIDAARVFNMWKELHFFKKYIGKKISQTMKTDEFWQKITSQLDKVSHPMHEAVAELELCNYLPLSC